MADGKSSDDHLSRSRVACEEVFDAIGHPTVILDPRHGIIAANRATERASGFTEAQMIGRKCYEIFHGKDVTAPPTGCPMEKMLTSNQFETVEMEMEAFGGIYLVSCTPVFDAAGSLDRIIHIATDITERKRVEQALRESEERYRIVADYSADWDFWLAPDGGLLYVSPACREVTGYSRDEFYADPELNTKVVHPDDRPLIERHKVEAFQSDQPLALEFRIVTRDGEVRWIAHVCQPVFDSVGEFRGRRASNRDITALKRAEAENRMLHAELERRVAERTAQLEATNHELEAFSYSVSHDLRAPLRHIEGFASILLEDCIGGLSEEGKDSLFRISRASRRMAELIDDLLNLSRYSRTEMAFDLVDLSDMAHEIAGELAKSEPGRAVTVTIREGLSVCGDANLLRVVMENLLGNAWKYTARAPEALIEFGVEERDGKRAYFVRDNGAGFDMTYAGKLFNAFQRLHGSDEFEGNGIGLATVRRIILRHGGEVWADACPDRGATFFFTLPDAGSPGNQYHP